MLRYTSSDTMLVDYMSQEYYGMLDLHVSENQCAFLRHADGKSDLFDPGEYVISQEKSSAFTGSLFASGFYPGFAIIFPQKPNLVKRTAL